MDAIIGKLNQIDYRKLIWVSAIAETIHNIEEAIWLPAASQAAGIWHPSISAFEFRFAVAVITLFFYGILFYFSRCGTTVARYLMGGALVMILFNVFIPHLAVTVITARYAPGVISGVLLNIPVSLYLLWRGLHEGVYSAKTLVWGSLAFALAAIPLLRGAFALGGCVESLM